MNPLVSASLQDHQQNDLELLIQVSLEIHRSLDLDDIFRASLSGINRMVQGAFGLVFLLESNPLELRLAHANGLDTDLLALLKKIPIDLSIAEGTLPVEVKSTVLATIGQHLSGILQTYAREPFVLVPITTPSHVIGVFGVGLPMDKILAPKTVDVLTLIGEQIGMAIENARLHASLKESEEWHRTFIENSPDGFWEGDFEGRITFVNDAVCRFLDYDRATLLTLRTRDIFLDDQDTRRAVGEILRREGVLVNHLGTARTRTGQIKAYTATTRVARDRQDKPVRYQSVLRDVTEQQHLLQTLSHRTQELAALNTIADILSHPLNLEHSLDRVCEKIASLVGMESVVLYLLDHSRQFLDLLACRGLGDELVSQVRRLGLDDPITRSFIEGNVHALKDVSAYSEVGLAGPRGAGYHAGIGVPIPVRGVATGALFVGSKTKASYEPADVSLLENIANQIGTALDNADLFARMERRVQELTSLAQLSAACASQLDPHAIANFTVEWIGKLTSSDFSSVRVFEGMTQRVLAARRKNDLAFDEKILQDELFHELFDQKAFYAITDTQADARISSEQMFRFRVIGLRSILIVSMPARDRVIGALSVGYDSPHDWKQEEIDLMQTMSNQVGVALENANLVARLQQRLEELGGLARLSAEVAGNLDPQSIAHTAVKWTQNLLPVDMSAVRIREGNTLCLLAGYLDNGHSLLECIEIDDTIRQIIEQRISVAVSDTETDSRGTLVHRSAFGSVGIRSLLIMPVPAHDHVIGFLTVGHTVPHPWAQPEIDLVQTIANQIGVALEKADLFTRMQRRLREIDGLAKLSAASVSSLDPQAISDLAVEWTQKLLLVEFADLRELKDGALYLSAVSALHPETITNEPIVLGDLFEPLVNKQTPLRVNDIREETGLPSFVCDGMNQRGLRSLLVVPMVTRDRVIGALAVSDLNPRRWQPSEIDLLQTIANHVANALDNANLLQNVLSERRTVQAILDSGLSGMYVTDVQGKFMLFARAAERITGWTEDLVRGKTWQEVFGDADPLINLALKGVQRYIPGNRTITTRDGRTIPVSEAVAPLHDEQNNVTGAVGAFWDLSREQAAEMERKEFLTLVAHQLRTPLTAVISALELYERPNLADERRGEMWAIVKSEGARLKKFADQFLDHEATTRSKPMRLETFDLVPLARRVARNFRSRKGKHVVHVKTERASVRVSANRDGVENVLSNLVDNAVCYSPEGSQVIVSVSIGDDTWVNVSVVDEGLGIPPAELENIFKPFYRSKHSPDRRDYGHGLGLAIARDLTTGMGGTIGVENNPERGTTFHFTLRRAR